MDEKIKSYFINAQKNNKIGHAFLIGNVKLSDIASILDNVISNSFFDGVGSIFNSPDVYILSTEKAIITKSDIIDVQYHIQDTSQISGYKIYIIDGAEKMNTAAANSLLKTLEEPEENVVAFLVTSNINNVLPTIKSRCQVLQVSSEANIENTGFDKAIVIKFAKALEIYGTDTIGYISDIFNKNTTQDDFNNAMTMLYALYKSALYYSCQKDYADEAYSMDEVKFVLENNSIKKISRKLICIHGIIELMSKSLNTSLLIDRFIIEFGRCCNE